MVVLSTPSWSWPELCDVKITGGPRVSRAFPYADLKTSLLDGIDPQWLIRWNGLPGTVASGAIEGAVMARAEKAGDRLAFVSDVFDLPEGTDIYLGSTTSARWRRGRAPRRNCTVATRRSSSRASSG